MKRYVSVIVVVSLNDNETGRYANKQISSINLHFLLQVRMKAPASNPSASLIFSIIQLHSGFYSTGSHWVRRWRLFTAGVTWWDLPLL